MPGRFPGGRTTPTLASVDLSRTEAEPFLVAAEETGYDPARDYSQPVFETGAASIIRLALPRSINSPARIELAAGRVGLFTIRSHSPVAPFDVGN